MGGMSAQIPRTGVAKDPVLGKAGSYGGPAISKARNALI